MINHKLIEKIKTTIAKHSMLTGGEIVLIGLSGGPDSVCLLTALNMLKAELSLELHAIYIDHGLRPSETTSEIEFCRKLCKGLAVPFVTKSINVKTYAKEHGLNKQEAARELRYRVFGEIASEIGASKIALGHNADDQLETFFMRVLRGSGPKGLSGIPPVRGRIIRPLIEIEREDIEEYLDEERVSYIVDSSNLKEDYLRNRIRFSLIPEIKRINPDITETMTRTMEIFREEDRYFAAIVAKTLMKLISRKTDLRIELFLAPMEAMDRVILRRVLRKAIDETHGLRGINFVHIEDIIDLIRKGKHGARLYLPKGIRVIKDYSTLVVTSEPPMRIETLVLNVPGEIVLKEARIVIKASLQDRADDLGDGRRLAVFDADKTGVVLTVRSREKGDFFYPMGFGKRKKLQDFFVDEKVPRDERDSVPIILSGNDIVWVTGYRGDERFKVTEETKRFLRMEIKRKV
ncbi:MAG: tRNA lysidine(34) synthetase TilS [Thermodesulfovibrionales bacterium]